MSKMKEFVAFRAMLALLKERKIENLLDDVQSRTRAALVEGRGFEENFAKALYEPFTDEQISKKIAQIVRPRGLKAELDVIYQTVDNLHKACSHHTGDWYFTGDYPTKGGNGVVNKAFLNFMEGKLGRAYEIF
jgi:amidophosphoribosyltransferase